MLTEVYFAEKEIRIINKSSSPIVDVCFRWVLSFMIKKETYRLKIYYLFFTDHTQYDAAIRNKETEDMWLISQ